MRYFTRELTSRRLICVKGALFLFAAILASWALLVRHPELITTLLLAIAIWTFARFYYFVFYVIEQYVDAGYQFRGLLSLVAYLAGKKKR